MIATAISGWPPKAGGAVDSQRLTQVGRALCELGIQMIHAYSPQRTGRSERKFATWQRPLPQELRLVGCTAPEQANRFFQLAAMQRGSVFVPRPNRDLRPAFSLQFARTVNRDNTVSFQNLSFQIEPVKWRGTLAGCSVTAHQHLDGTLSLSYGPHCLGRYDAAGAPLPAVASRADSRRRKDLTLAIRANKSGV